MSYNESLNSNSNYPPISQADWDRAPWSQKEPKPKEIEVTVSVTLSKTMKVKVDDYTIVSKDGDEDGQYYEDIDFSDCDLVSAVKDQHYLPQDAGKYIGEALPKDARKIADLSGWTVDEFEVIQ